MRIPMQPTLTIRPKDSYDSTDGASQQSGIGDIFNCPPEGDFWRRHSAQAELVQKLRRGLIRG